MLYLRQWSREHRLTCETWDGDLRENFEKEEPWWSMPLTLEPGRLRKEDHQFEASDWATGYCHSSIQHLPRMCKALASIINTTEKGEKEGKKEEEKEEEERE